jgi:hypothetical protein
VKKASGEKAIWVNGVLAVSGVNPAALPTEYTSLWIGSGPAGENSLQNRKPEHRDDICGVAADRSYERRWAPSVLRNVQLVLGHQSGGKLHSQARILESRDSW